MMANGETISAIPNCSENYEIYRIGFALEKHHLVLASAGPKEIPLGVSAFYNWNTLCLNRMVSPKNKCVLTLNLLFVNFSFNTQVNLEVTRNSR